ncbi:MAG: hypothetical protein KGL39_07545 [Patescibacteria group bacterium]|nr:hypothetical protein [Patescibacteria group bacterium]
MALDTSYIGTPAQPSAPPPSSAPASTSAPPKAPASDLGSLAGQIVSIEARRNRAIDPMLKQEAANLAQQEKESAAAYQRIQPVKPTAAPNPAQYERNPWDAFFSLNSVFGILASAATHQPWYAGVMSAAAAVNAVKQQDALAYQQAYEQWKTNTDLMFKIHNEQMADWQALNAQSRNDFVERDALIKQYAAKYGDEATALYHAAGLDIQMQELQDKRALLGPQLEILRNKAAISGVQTGGLLRILSAQNLPSTDPTRAQKIHDATEQYLELEGMSVPPEKRYGAPVTLNYTDANGKPAETQGVYDKFAGQWVSSVGRQPITGTNFSVVPANMVGTQLSPTDLKSYGAERKAGMPMSQVYPGFSGYQIKQEINREAIKQIMADHPGMSAEEAGLELANNTIKFDASRNTTIQLTKMLGFTQQAVRQLDFNAQQVEILMKKVGVGHLSPVLNRIANGIKYAGGNPDIARLQFFVNAMADEAARIISGGQASAAQLHATAMSQAKYWASANMTPEMMREQVNGLLKEGEQRINTYNLAIQSQRLGAPPLAAPPAPAPTTAPQSQRVLRFDPTTGTFSQ